MKALFVCENCTTHVKRSALRFFVFFLIGFFSAQGEAFAQLYSNHPPKLKWQRLETEHLELVFPKGLDSVAQRTANLMEYAYGPVTKTLETEPRKISFFLFNQSSVSNGYVTPVNPMMAWYSTPMQDVRRLGSDDWFQTLSVHEYRHVTQFEKMDQRATHVAGVLFGRSGSAVVALMSHPMWFAEGDAVVTETALTHGGRGRVPSFASPMRAIVMSGQPHSYDRTYMGSYKYYYPNHYTLGYYMVAYGRREFGPYFWSDVLDRTSRYPYWPYQFSMSLRRNCGLSVRKFYNKAMADLAMIWGKMEEGRRYTYAQPVVGTDKKVYTNYSNPLVLADGSLFVYKSGFDHSGEFVIVKDDKEEKILLRSPDGDITTDGKLLVWAESVTDIRFLERSYSDVFCYSVADKKVKRLTRKQKYFAPAISPGGSMVAVIEYTSELQCSLVILSADDGHVIKTTKIKDGGFLRTPSWSADEKTIVCTKTIGEKNYIMAYDVESMQSGILYGPTYAPIGKPQILGDYLMYNSPETGIDAVCAIDLRDTAKHYVALQTRFGAYSPCLSADKLNLYYEDYSAKGTSVVQSEFDSRAWELFSVAKKQAEDYCAPLVEQEQGKSIFEGAIPDSTYAISRYRTLKNLININGYALIPQNEGVLFSIYSNNKLNTLSAEARLAYNENERDFSELLKLQYTKFFPVLSIVGVHGYRTDAVEYEKDKYQNYHWREKTAGVGVELPFSFLRNHRTTFCNVFFGGVYKSIDGSDVVEQVLYDGQDIPVNDPDAMTRNEKIYYRVKPNGKSLPVVFSLDFMNLKDQSYRDLQPNWGQVIQIRSEYGISKYSDVGTKQLSFFAKEYFPGFMPSHGISLSGGYEWQSPYNWMCRAPSHLAYVRGYDYQSSNKWALASLSYSLPLFYPDIHLGGTFHLKRVRMQMFYDHAFLEDHLGVKNTSDVVYPFVSAGTLDGEIKSSAGAEFTFDFQLFRWLPLPLSTGFRGSYLVEKDEVVFEITLLGASL